MSVANGRSTLRQRYETPLTIILIVVGIVLISACANLASLFLARATARQAEFRLRLALGAGPHDIRRLILRRVVLLVGIGIVVGLAISFWAGRFIQTQLFALEPRDPVTLAGAAVVLFAIALLAGWLPARRAARIDPVIVLRG